MQIDTGISYIEHGLKSAIKGMQIQNQIVNLANENVIGFDKVGYQRKEIVNSSFQEFMGADAMSTVVDDKVGRIVFSDQPLDLALANKGYFQIQEGAGVKLTRDGRFKIDKEGNLLTLEDHKVLSESGAPIKLPFVPDNIEKIKVTDDGKIKVFNDKTLKLVPVATLGIVDSHNVLVEEPVIKQGYCEFSNVSMATEFMDMMPVIRNFEANRQLFLIQNQTLQKVINQLGQV